MSEHNRLYPSTAAADTDRQHSPSETPLERSQELGSPKTPQFTPGPWHVDFPDNYPFEAFVNASDEDERDYHLITVTSGEEAERDANAHLIAAAPEMYEALKSAIAAIVDITDFLVRHGYDKTRIKEFGLKPIRAAIAKAEGGAR